MNTYKKILGLITTTEEFNIPSKRQGDTDFPDYLKNKLDQYVNYYEHTLSKLIDDTVVLSSENKKSILNIIKDLSKTIIESVDLYYKGKVFKASENFTKKLNRDSINSIMLPNPIEKGSVFYRARIDNSKQFKTGDLFHVRYEQRDHVSTNRYSIPGFPALYLGSNTHICWEEFGKPKLDDLWFVKLENQKTVNVLSLLRMNDFLRFIDGFEEELKLNIIAKYLATFPLTLASTVKVKNPRGSFKPEYIIPQMLFEYIANNEKVDGLKFPSTKVDYSALLNIEAYNYVFPTKKLKKRGYCSELTSCFFITEPTSLRLEEIINDPSNINENQNDTTLHVERKIELIKDVKVDYDRTSFGRLESKLKNRKVYQVE